MTKVLHKVGCARERGGECTCGASGQYLAHKRQARMARIDNLTPELRELVHEYGWNTVNAFIDSGVTRARNIRHCVETVLDEFSPTRCSSSSQGGKEKIARQMTKDWLARTGGLEDA